MGYHFSLIPNHYNYVTRIYNGNGQLDLHNIKTTRTYFSGRDRKRQCDSLLISNSSQHLHHTFDM